MINSALLQEIKGIQEEFFHGLRTIMQINSVKSEPEPTAPFGPGPKKALLATLALAKDLGFHTHLVNSAIGYAQLGEGEEYIGVIGHLDVVPAGDGWDYPPFDLTLDDNVFYGRGVLDNKGPIIANLYALYALKKSNIPLKYPIRIIFGTDEESGSKDIPMYLEHEKPPLFGYTPDCKYPAVYGERGILGVDMTTYFTDDSLADLHFFKGNFDKSWVPDSLTYGVEGMSFQIKGERSPSNAPELGDNVITLFAQHATTQKNCHGELDDYLHWVYQAFHEQHHGEGLNMALKDDALGTLSLTPHTLTFHQKEKSSTLSLSIRYPISIKEEELVALLTKQLPKQTVLNITRSMPSTCFDTHHPMIEAMTRVYESATGLDGTPVTTTGATYARVMPNILAFGPSFPGQKGIAHNKNEYMDKNDLIKNLEIYTCLLAELQTL